MRILFVTGNGHKLQEAKEILEGHEVVGKDLDVLEIQSLDPKEIIAEKLREAKAQVGETEAAILVEDVAFWIGDTGLPGPLIKFFNNTIGPEGDVRFGKAFGTDRAKAESHVGLLLPGASGPEFFVGVVEGRLVDPRGDSGFGFDPVFQPEGYAKTFAEMDSEEKHDASHRGRTLRKVAERLGR